MPEKQVKSSQENESSSQIGETAFSTRSPAASTSSVVGPSESLSSFQAVSNAQALLNTDKYKIKGLIGRGGMGEVYQAFQPALQRNVAVKLIHTHLAQTPQMIERFQREARMVASLRHPGIIQVHDFDMAGTIFYMVMEFVPGQSLKQYLDHRRMSGQQMTLSEVWSLFYAITEAMAYAHRQGVIHRDLKPANILLTARNEPILVDFGLSKIVSDQGLTLSGEIFGTPAYMSPEQGKGEQTDARTDVYALGIILYELVLGSHPFSGNTPFEIVSKHLNDPPPSIISINPSLPKALDRIIQKALAKTPDERYQSAQELLTALQNEIEFYQNPTTYATITSNRPGKDTRESQWPRLSYEPETVLIPAGTFLMGHPLNLEEVWPLHKVPLAAYKIGKYPVTNQQYAEFVKQYPDRRPRKAGWRFINPPLDRLNHPVVGVSWYDALSYCRWLSRESSRRYRLPSEAEWEKAARGAQDKRIYPWGDDLNQNNCNYNSTQTTPVNQYDAGQSPFGCYDMAGNVREWTSTLWGKNWKEAQFVYPYQMDDREDLNAPSTIYRIYRGGAYNDEPGRLGCSSRGYYAPAARDKNLGFRVALTL